MSIRDEARRRLAELKGKKPQAPLPTPAKPTQPYGPKSQDAANIQNRDTYEATPEGNVKRGRK